MDRRILPAAPGAIQRNANNSPSHSGQSYMGGQPSNEDDVNHASKSSARSGTGTKRRSKKEGDAEGGDEEEGAKKKKVKRRKVDHACVYCRSVLSGFYGVDDVAQEHIILTGCRRSHMTCDAGRVSDGIYSPFSPMLNSA